MPGLNRKRRSWIHADWFLRWFTITNKGSQLRYELNALLKPTTLGEAPQPRFHRGWPQVQGALRVSAFRQSEWFAFHGGQLTSLSQLIKPDYLSTQHHSSFRNLPCLDLWCLFTPLILTQTEEAIRYLEFCIERLGNRDQAIHNYLLSLYIEQEDDESLLRYLQMQGQVWY